MRNSITTSECKLVGMEATGNDLKTRHTTGDSRILKPSRLAAWRGATATAASTGGTGRELI